MPARPDRFPYRTALASVCVAGLTCCVDPGPSSGPGGTAPVGDAARVGDAASGDVAATDTAGLDSAGGDTATGETGNGGDTGSTDGGCSAATCKGYCVAATGNCVDCIGDAHCGQGYGCVAQKCVPKTGCTVGASQCQTAGALLVCPEGKGWQVIACASGTVCDGGACIKPYCSPGKPACKGHTAGTCNATGTGVDNGTDCKTSGKFCVAGQCKAQVCSPGDSYCDGTLASVCNEQGTGPEEQDDCALMGMMCVDGNCEESPCQGGGLGCVGNDVVQCNAAEVKVVKTCGLSEACYEGQCKPKVCNPGEGKCVDDTTVQFCNDAGTAWDISMNCGTPNGYCENGDCKAMPCPNGGKGCQNTGVVQCNGKVVTVVEDCATKGLSCWNGACAAKVCTPGATQCNGDTMEFCNGSGTGWDPGIPCGAMGMTCFGGQCQKAPCKPGDLGCEGNTVVQCNGPKPTPVQDCGAMGQVCEAGACVNPICTPNDVLCDGTKVMQCNLAGTALIAVDDCAKAGQVCLDGVCAAMPCLPGGKGCKGTDVVQCDGAGKTFSVVEACGDAGGTCANAACMSAACAPGFGKCNGAVVQNCASDGSGWDGGDNCAKAGKNCSEGFCTSKACPPGVAGCQGAQVAACPATGAGWAMTACASGQTCNGGACLTPGCTLPATQPAHAVRAMLWEPMEKDQGCDLDGDGTLDNEAGKFALAIAGQFPQPGGQMTHIALAADAWKTDGSAFAVQLLVGLAAAGQTCSPTDPKASCKVAIVPESYDLTAKSGVCPARTVLADGKVKGNQFTAGGPTSLAHLPLAPVPMLGWLPLKLARVQGEPTAGPGWTGLHKGRLCGAMVKAELISALAKVNPLVFESSGVSLPNIQQALEKALTADIDSDGDGKKDAVSLALRFVGGKVELQGL